MPLELALVCRLFNFLIHDLLSGQGFLGRDCQIVVRVLVALLYDMILWRDGASLVPPPLTAQLFAHLVGSDGPFQGAAAIFPLPIRFRGLLVALLVIFRCIIEVPMRIEYLRCHDLHVLLI